ncbi:MAG: sodium:solute symporter [Phycisphaerae bacterium]|nr:sodium:solute symporter [Phycisphaerae bacterium]
MNLHPLDILMLLVYLGGMAAMGFYFSRKNVNTEEYFVGGRSFSGWIIGLSMVGTSISSITFLAYPGDAFKTAWLRFTPNFMLPLGVLIAAFVFLPFFRRGKVTSAYQYLEGRFGPSIRVYASSAFIIGQLTRVSMILYLLSLVIYEITGLSPIMCIVVGGGFVALYTVLGGIDAVIWTDVIQTIVLVVGGAMALFVIIDKLPGGLGQILSVATAENKLSLAEWEDGVVKPASWALSFENKTAMMMLILGLTGWLGEYSSNQNVIQRYCASRSANEARKAMFVCAFASVPIWAFFMFIGTSLYVFYKVFPCPEAAQMLSGELKAEQVLPFFIINELPPGITGLVIAAALAAAMSSLDSSINAIATIGIVDIYRRHLVKNRDDRHYLKVAKILACAAGAIMIGGAVALTETEGKTLQDTGTILASLLGGGVFGMYMLGFFTRRGDARAVGVGIVCSLLFTVWTILVEKNMLPGPAHVPFDLYYTGLIGNIISFAVGFLIGSLFPAKPRSLTNLTVWDQDGKPLD